MSILRRTNAAFENTGAFDAISSLFPSGVYGGVRCNPWFWFVFTRKSLMSDENHSTDSACFSTEWTEFPTDSLFGVRGRFRSTYTYISLSKKRREIREKGRTASHGIGPNSHGFFQLYSFCSTGWRPSHRLFRGNPWDGFQCHNRHLSPPAGSSHGFTAKYARGGV